MRGCLLGLPLLLLAAHSAVAEERPQAQGVLRGAEEALLSSDMAGRIVRITDEGAAFHKGDVLVEFACEGQKAEEDVARAGDKGAKARLDNQRRLDATKSAGRLDVDLAEAHQAETRAMVRAAEAKAALCRVLGPYDGVVLRREARAYESVGLMAPLVRVARSGPPEVTIIIPAAWLSWLKVGTPFTFIAAATAERVEGRVSHLGRAVDPSSQTMEILGTLGAETGDRLRSGMAGAVSFPAPPASNP